MPFYSGKDKMSKQGMNMALDDAENGWHFKIYTDI